MAGKLAQHYNRVISDVLIEVLRPGGGLYALMQWRDADLTLRDVQLRREPKGRRCWVSLYLGLTSVLDVEELGGRFRLRVHLTHRLRGRFDDAWAEWMNLEVLVPQLPAVLAYLDRVGRTVDSRWTSTEGRTHALLANSARSGVSVINREASISFRDMETRKELLNGWASSIDRAITAAGHRNRWWTLLQGRSMGTSPDFIASDQEGRLLVIEAKPSSATDGIVWGPAQVLLYAAMFAQWLHDQPQGVDVLRQELRQRAALGLLPAPGTPELPARPSVVPVLAIGPGITGPEAWSRLLMVQHALADVFPAMSQLAPLEIWRLADDGTPTTWHWEVSESPYPTPTAEDMEHSTYAQRARATAVRWKHDSLPSEAQDDGAFRGGANSDVYPFCLPTGQTHLNLLSQAAAATDFFAAQHIQWHASVAGGPTSHLLSSQVQCVNALFAMTHDPDLIKRAFGDVLSISEALPVEDDAYLTFEYIGLKDHLGEAAGLRRRGANCTSLDAAIRYRTDKGHIEIALIEWKYTEQYRGNKLSPDRANIRKQRYQSLWLSGDGPVRSDVIPYDDIFVEPFYQLVRQQMLAWRMEQDHEQGAKRVRVVHIAPRGNTAYYTSLNRDTHRAAGRDVSEVWHKMLRRPDRFISLDSGRFTDRTLDLTSPAYRARYGHG